MKLFIVVLAVAVFISGAAFAQATNPDQSQSSSSPQSSQSQATPSQSDQNQSMSQSQSNASSDQTLTGCIVRREQAVFLQPATGGQAIKLSGSQDWGDMTHQARITGHYGSEQSASNAGTASQSQPGQSSIAGNAGSQSQSGQDFIVTKVESVTESCPASGAPSTPPGSSAPPPVMR